MITHVCMFKLQQENHKEIVDEAVKLADSLYTIPNAVKGEVEEGLLFCGAKAWKSQKMETVPEVIRALFG